jgi:hypothetical protein
MKGDFSRLTFDALKHYVGVLHQQGRVWLDSDWNEDVFERLNLLQQETSDIIGVCGVPEPGTAFQISPNPDPNAPPDDFLIAGGKGPLGRCYVDGILCQLEATTSYLTQPDLPDPPRILMPTDGSALNAVVYLEVWQRLITFLEDDKVREVALGGPDSATRLKTVAQVKVAVIPRSVPVTALTCANARQFLPPLSGGTLTTLQPQDTQPEDLCRLPDPSNFTGRENHLYRVEIHNAGGVGAVGSVPAARFKWSHDNAAFAVGIKAVSTDRRTLTLTSLGRDQATALRQGDLVEISDDASELGPARGHLTYLTGDPDPDQFTVSIADPLPPSFSVGGVTIAPTSPPFPANGSQVTRHPILRRWDGQGTANATFSETTTPDMNLGDGVHIQFGGANLQSGDYWQFAARSADGSVEALTDEPPMGIIRHRCPLAIVQWSLPAFQSPPSSPPSGRYVLRQLEDCRRVFPALVDFPRTEAGMQVTGVFIGDSTTGQATQLSNDSNVLVTSLLGGITVQCDTAVDPTTITAPTCFLSVELPFLETGRAAPASPPAVQLIGYQTLTLAGTVSATGSTIRWVPGPGAATALPNLAALKPPDDRGILTRLTLKGNFIWAADKPTLFLDGDAFGQPGAGVTSLHLPSGDNRRGGDFGMWFWLITQPATVTDLQINPSLIFVGDPAIGTVTLSDPAPPGGAVVALANSNTAVATVPANVTVAAGSDRGTFAITGNAQGATTIIATLGGVSRADTLTVVVRPITLGALNVPGVFFLRDDNDNTWEGTVTLKGAAPQGGVTINLESDNPRVATVPGSVTVPARETTASFFGTAINVGQATITATLGGVSTQGTLNVRRKLGKEGKDKDKEPADVPFRPRPFDLGGGIPRSGGNPDSTSPTSLPGSDDPEGTPPTGRAFIRSDERPVVGEAILNQPDHEEHG